MLVLELLSFEPLALLRNVAIAIVLYLLSVFIYAYFLSPIHKIPGPWYARVSRLPLLWAIYHRQHSAYASTILMQYKGKGSTVLIAPNQVHTTDSTAMKTIYNRSAVKTKFYAGMGSWKGVTSVLGFLTYAEAAPKRNNLIQCFQNKNLAALVENMSSHIADFCGILREKDKAGEDVDGLVLTRLLALDILTDIVWGEKRRLLSDVSKESAVFIRRFHAFTAYNAIRAWIPGLDTYVRLLGTRKWRQLRCECEDMDITAKEALQWWNEQKVHRDRDVLSMLKAMDNEDLDERRRVPESHIPAYMVEMLAAGSSTTSHTVTFCCWQLMRHPEAANKLREELEKAFPDKGDIDERKTMELPWLDAVIRETMRLMPMLPGPLPRYIGEAIEVDGIAIPPGTVASTSAFDQGRLAVAYPDPESWKPERWFDATEEMHLNWIPFGSGSRSCPGVNLAMTEMKYTLGTVFRLFRVEAPLLAENRQDDLELMDVFGAGPKSGHVWLRFVEA